MQTLLIDRWQQITKDEPCPWVLFANGTAVMLTEPEADPEAQAKSILSHNGKVIDGTDQGDFGIINLPDGQGWLVTCSHPDVFTLVTPEEVEGKTGWELSDFKIGMYGREKRQKDYELLEVICQRAE